MTEYNGKQRYLKILWGPFLGLLLMALLVILEQTGIKYGVLEEEQDFLPEAYLLEAPDWGSGSADTLILWVSNQEHSQEAKEYMEDLLQIMRENYLPTDLSQQNFPDLSDYKRIVICFSDLDLLKQEIFVLMDWVEGGGRLMLAVAPEPGITLKVIGSQIGISDGGLVYQSYNSIRVADDFMPGAAGQVFLMEGGEDAVLSILLDEQSQVCIEDAMNGMPLLWQRSVEHGRVVVCNYNLLEKVSRGLYCSAFSLLDDAYAYPVINSSVFFIDDFPSPVPQGTNPYITAAYHCTVETFYTNIWWPDMIRLMEKYGIKYTGVVIENYENQIAGPFARNTNTELFQYFGNLLLNKGGEVGLHGYNHQPLCLDDFEYTYDMGYKTWRSVEDISAAVTELNNFCQGLFPEIRFRTYVPPSNILSPEGRAALLEACPDINMISGIYQAVGTEYGQEFTISEDGIYEFPRIISSFEITEYMKWSAFSELSMHYVNSHFMHPDDLLDEDRGAATGWEVLKKKYEDTIRWLYDSAPGLRSMTAQDGAKALERYVNLQVGRRQSDNQLILELEGFYDEAWLMLRLNGKSLGLVQGGTVTPVCGDLYLLHALSPQVIISLE